MLLIVCDWCGRWGEVNRRAREYELGTPEGFRRHHLRGTPSDSDPLVSRVSYEACSDDCEEHLLANVPSRKVMDFSTTANTLKERLDVLAER
jgi:hypothetical protein